MSKLNLHKGILAYNCSSQQIFIMDKRQKMDINAFIQCCIYVNDKYQLRYLHNIRLGSICDGAFKKLRKLAKLYVI